MTAHRQKSMSEVPPSTPAAHESPDRLRAVPGGMSLRLGPDLITPRLERADRMWSRMRGLLGRRSLDADAGLWITPCNSIHMMFMRFPIDAIFIDANLQVVRVHSTVKPWGFARGGKHAKSVLELPAGKATFFNIRVGDRLSIDGYGS